ncbi:MAG: BREX system P-loop protein BrxC, partial [Pseudohongiellaceae bacterium]
THRHSSLVLEPQIEFTASQVRTLKAFYEDFFDGPPRSREAKVLGKEAGEAFLEMFHQLNPLAAQADQYPFLNALKPVLDTLKEVAGKPYTWHLTELSKQDDQLLTWKEDVIDPILKFMSGSQRDIYNQARTMLQSQESNFIYVSRDDINHIRAILNDPDCYKGSRVQQLKGQVDSLQALIDEKVRQTRSQATASLNTMQARMQNMDEYQSLPEPRQEELNKPFRDLADYIGQERLIAVIKDRVRYFEEEGYQKLLVNMEAMANQKSPSPEEPDRSHEKQDDEQSVQTKEQYADYVHSRNLHVAFDKAWLADENDVDQYLDSLRDALLCEIRQGRKVQI